jgi:hypothetical protein
MSVKFRSKVQSDSPRNSSVCQYFSSNNNSIPLVIYLHADLKQSQRSEDASKRIKLQQIEKNKNPWKKEENEALKLMQLKVRFKVIL